MTAHAAIYLLAGGGALLVSPGAASVDFLVFFLDFFDLVSELPELSDMPDVSEDAPLEPEPAEGLDMPVAPLPVAGEPDISPALEAPDDAPLLPDEAPALPELGVLDDGMADDGEVALLPELVPAAPLGCANTTVDTDATMTNDSDRSVDFNVMSNSLN